MPRAHLNPSQSPVADPGKSPDPADGKSRMKDTAAEYVSKYGALSEEKTDGLDHDSESDFGESRPCRKASRASKKEATISKASGSRRKSVARTSAPQGSKEESSDDVMSDESEFHAPSSKSNGKKRAQSSAAPIPAPSVVPLAARKPRRSATERPKSYAPTCDLDGRPFRSGTTAPATTSSDAVDIPSTSDRSSSQTAKRSDKLTARAPTSALPDAERRNSTRIDDSDIEDVCTDASPPQHTVSTSARKKRKQTRRIESDDDEDEAEGRFHAESEFEDLPGDRAQRNDAKGSRSAGTVPLVDDQAALEQRSSSRAEQQTTTSQQPAFDGPSHEGQPRRAPTRSSPKKPASKSARPFRMIQSEQESEAAPEEVESMADGAPKIAPEGCTSDGEPEVAADTRRPSSAKKAASGGKEKRSKSAAKSPKVGDSEKDATNTKTPTSEEKGTRRSDEEEVEPHALSKDAEETSAKPSSPNIAPKDKVRSSSGISSTLS